MLNENIKIKFEYQTFDLITYRVSHDGKLVGSIHLSINLFPLYLLNWLSSELEFLYRSGLYSLPGLESYGYSSSVRDCSLFLLNLLYMNTDLYPLIWVTKLSKYCFWDLFSALLRTIEQISLYLTLISPPSQITHGESSDQDGPKSPM